MANEEKIRIDKWLWAVRIFKTRSAASEACRKGRIIINGVPVKPSREISFGDVIAIKTPPIVRSYKVKDISGKRMSAKLVVDFVEEVTPKSQLELLDSIKLCNSEKRPRGVGRPTKRDRRMIERLRGIGQ